MRILFLEKCIKIDATLPRSMFIKPAVRLAKASPTESQQAKVEKVARRKKLSEAERRQIAEMTHPSQMPYPAAWLQLRAQTFGMTSHH